MGELESMKKLSGAYNNKEKIIHVRLTDDYRYSVGFIFKEGGVTHDLMSEKEVLKLITKENFRKIRSVK